MFTKEQFEQWRLDKSDVQLNKLMIKEFPFLLPRNRWTGLVDDDYDYSYNELEAMSEGWLIAFGYEMICELRDELASANLLNDYRIMEIKEKYGTLCWYDAGNTKKKVWKHFAPDFNNRYIHMTEIMENMIYTC